MSRLLDPNYTDSSPHRVNLHLFEQVFALGLDGAGRLGGRG